MPIRIADRVVGPGTPLFAIAEIGLNHGGSGAEALRLVGAAAEAGASAVKLQTLVADRLVAAHCPAPAHVTARSLREFFRQFELDEAAHQAVATEARANGLAVMSTPFDETSVDLLERVGVDAYKIASGDLTNVGLIRRVAATGRPVVISTGMSSLDEVSAAVANARDAGAESLAVLHCVSSYPVPAGSENLAAIATMTSALRLPVGLSDHGTTPEAIVVATAFGACIYERHLIASADSVAIDAPVSSTPEQFRQALAAAERARQAIGDGRKRCLPAEAANVGPSRRGLYARRDLRPGERVLAADMIALRPAEGIPASALDLVAGSRTTRAIAAGASLGWDDLVIARDLQVHHAM
jgi:sialic acid synthase SpsE